MKLKIKSLANFVKFNYLIKYLNLLILIVFIISLLWLGYFLYQNIYLALQKIEKITASKNGDIFTEELKTDLYQKISENFSKKQTGINLNLENFKDPFKHY